MNLAQRFRDRLTPSAALSMACAAPLLLLACGGQLQVSTKQPAQPPRCEASGETADAPLLSSWPAPQRSALGRAMKAGIAVVKYDGCSVSVLERCTLHGAYDFTGVKAARVTTPLASGAELAKHVYGDHAGLTSKLRAGHRFSLVQDAVGTLDASVVAPSALDLDGDCRGATHVVSSMLIGAYRIQQLGGAGKLVDGAAAPAACELAAAGATTPPAGCAESVRPRLTRLARTAPVAPKRHDPEACAEDDAAECALACARANGSACTTLGWMLEEGKVVSADPARASQLYRLSCAAGQQLACTNLAAMYLAGRGVKQNAGAAAGLFKTACRGDDQRACSDLAVLYRDGVGVPVDTGRAALLARIACDRGDPHGCNVFAELLSEGLGVTANHEQALKLLQRTCAQGDADGCTWAAKEDGQTPRGDATAAVQPGASAAGTDDSDGDTDTGDEAADDLDLEAPDWAKETE